MALSAFTRVFNALGAFAVADWFVPPIVVPAAALIAVLVFALYN